jgi:hypothetical protein
VSLDALAPDQRAVVQLVLQQERSYEDLAGLLGITAAAVRERAHKGLDRLGPTEGVSDDERAAVADYLLGQQSVSRREATRALLATSGTARAWAQAVSAELADVARSPLPEVPETETARAAAESTDVGGPFVPDDKDAEQSDWPVIADPVVEEPAEDVAPTRARPRPRREPAPVPDYGFDEPAERTAEPLGADGARTSRLGGALLIAGLGIFVAALIVWLVTRGDDTEKSSSGSTTATETSTPTPAATPDFQPIGALALKSATGGSGRGQMILFAAQTGQVAFNIKATHVPQSQQGQAYGVWLTGGDKDHFLGFAPPVGKNGRLAVSGPRDRDQSHFARWFTSAKELVVSTETQEGATSPGPLVLSGQVKDLITAGATATATP